MERDEETGFSYHGVRYYAPWLGRWTTYDPTGSAVSVNLYHYCRCSPIRYEDPNGREEKDKIDFMPKGKGGRSGKGLNVDEPKAVGEPGISAAERMSRAKDILRNRQFLNWIENQDYKGARKEIGPGAKREPLPSATALVSVKDQPSAIWRPTLENVKEWRELADLLSKKLESRLAKVKSPLRAKEIINDEIRAELKSPKTEPGKALHEALRSQLPDPPTEWFKSNTSIKRLWTTAKGKEAAVQAGVLVAGAVVAYAEGASAEQAQEQANIDLRKQSDAYGRFATDNPEMGILVVQAFEIRQMGQESAAVTNFRFAAPVYGYGEYDALKNYYESTRLESATDVFSRMEYRYLWIPPLDERPPVPVRVAPPM